jgi:hypothetical protein
MAGVGDVGRSRHQDDRVSETMPSITMVVGFLVGLWWHTRNPGWLSACMLFAPRVFIVHFERWAYARAVAAKERRR